MEADKRDEIKEVRMDSRNTPSRGVDNPEWE
jgi:hypothetical protein